MVGMCKLALSQDLKETETEEVIAEETDEVAEELLNEYETLEEEVIKETGHEKAQNSQKEEVKKVEDPGLKEGTALDDKTYARIIQYRRDAQISNLQITAVRMALTKANDGYFNNLKIWLALHGVKEPDLDKWQLNGKRVYLKKKK